MDVTHLKLVIFLAEEVTSYRKCCKDHVHRIIEGILTDSVELKTYF
jgi:hypothetical protein